MATSCLYICSAMFTKVSLLVFYLRTFRPSKAARLMVWLGIGAIVPVYVTSLLTFSVNCKPTQWPLNPVEYLAVQRGSKRAALEKDLFIVQGVFSIVSDIYVLTIPIIFAWGLQLPLRRRIGICLIFLVGLLFDPLSIFVRKYRVANVIIRATACSVAITYFFFRQLTSKDISWNSTLISMFRYNYYAPHHKVVALDHNIANIRLYSSLELSAGILCGCIPVVFGTIKHAMSVSLTPIKNHLRIHYRKSNAITADGISQPQIPSSFAPSQNGLFMIPRATVTRLRTLIRGGLHGGDLVKLTDMPSYIELHFIDGGCHAQQKEGPAF